MTLLPGSCRECWRKMTKYDKQHSKVLCGLCISRSDREKNAPAIRPSGFDLACIEAAGEWVADDPGEPT